MSRLETARDLASKIQLIPELKGCLVDDWDREQRTFTLIATIDTNDGGSRHFPKGYKGTADLRPISSKIRSLLKAHGATVACPKRVYESVFGERYFRGYESNRIMIDLVVYNS
jgi:hypothetical protein